MSAASSPAIAPLSSDSCSVVSRTRRAVSASPVIDTSERDHHDDGRELGRRELVEPGHASAANAYGARGAAGRAGRRARRNRRERPSARQKLAMVGDPRIHAVEKRAQRAARVQAREPRQARGCVHRREHVEPRSQRPSASRAWMRDIMASRVTPSTGLDESPARAVDESQQVAVVARLQRLDLGAAQRARRVVVDGQRDRRSCISGLFERGSRARTLSPIFMSRVSVAVSSRSISSVHDEIASMSASVSMRRARVAGVLRARTRDRCTQSRSTAMVGSNSRALRSRTIVRSEVPRIARGLEVIAAVVHAVHDAHEVPVQEVAQAGADVGARHAAASRRSPPRAAAGRRGR